MQVMVPDIRSVRTRTRPPTGRFRGRRGCGCGAALRSGYIGAMTTVHVPYTVEQDEDGVWCAHAWLGSSGGANGNGATADEAIADLREAVRMVIEEDGIPAQLARSLDLDVA